MSNINSQHNYGSRRAYTKARKGRAIFYPPFLTKYLKQQVQEYQKTIDFLEDHYGEAAAQELCEKPAKHIVMLNAVILCLEELQEFQEMQAKKRHLLDIKLKSLTGQSPETNSNTKPSP